jgi:uncharacterized protein YndB with AHSA1/START domain
MKVERSIEIGALPEKVWPLISERDNIVRWHPNAERFDFVGEQHSGVGAVFYMVGNPGRQIMRSLCEITEWRENEKMTFRQIMGMGQFESAYTIEATGTGSRLIIAWDYVLPFWVIGMVMGLLTRKMWVEMSDQMLRNIKGLAEA